MTTAKHKPEPAAPDSADTLQLPFASSRWRTAISYFVMLLAVVFLGRALWQSAGDLADLNWKLSVSGTIGSLLLVVGSLSFAPLMWQRILADFGRRLTYSESFAVYFVMALTKYLPGSVWAYVGMAHYGRRLDIPPSTTIVAALVQQAVACGGSVLMFGLSVVLWPDATWLYYLAAVGIWVAAGVALLTPALKRFLNFVATRLLKQNTDVRFTRTGLIVSLIYFMASWLFFIVGFHWLLQGFYPVTWREAVIFTGIYAISWLIGFLAFITPSGLGVRDSVQAWLLSFFVPPSIGVTIALVQRLWLIVADLITGLISLWLLKRSR